jgi:hypothetical protein
MCTSPCVTLLIAAINPEDNFNSKSELFFEKYSKNRLIVIMPIAYAEATITFIAKYSHCLDMCIGVFKETAEIPDPIVRMQQITEKLKELKKRFPGNHKFIDWVFRGTAPYLNEPLGQVWRKFNDKAVFTFHNFLEIIQKKAPDGKCILYDPPSSDFKNTCDRILKEILKIKFKDIPDCFFFCQLVVYSYLEKKHIDAYTTDDEFCDKSQEALKYIETTTFKEIKVTVTNLNKKQKSSRQSHYSYLL